MPRLPAIQRFDSSVGMRIYRIPTRVLPELSARVYLVLGAGPPTLVDTGSGRKESTQDILKGLETVRGEFGEPVCLEDIERIYLTHGHLDHIGGLPDLVRPGGAKVGIHPLDLPKISDAEHQAAELSERMRSFLEGAGVAPSQREELVQRYGGARDVVPAQKVEMLLQDNQECDGLRFLHTPGHAPGHLCIAVGDVLLTGDHVLPRTMPQQWPESYAPHAGLAHYLKSLARIRALPGFRLALGGHEQVMHDLYERIDQIEETQHRRVERVWGIVHDAKRPLTIAEIASRAYREQKGFFAFLAATDVGARVEYLQQQGRLVLANAEEIERGTARARRYGVVE